MNRNEHAPARTRTTSLCDCFSSPEKNVSDRFVYFVIFFTPNHSNESGKGLVDRWNSMIAREASQREVPAQGFLINGFAEYSRSALDIIGKAGFGYDFGALKDNCPNELYDAFESCFKLLVTGSLYSTLRTQADWIPTVGHYLCKEQKELEKQKKVIDGIASRLVNNARDQAVREGQLGTGLTKDDFGKDLLSILGEFDRFRFAYHLSNLFRNVSTFLTVRSSLLVTRLSLHSALKSVNRHQGFREDLSRRVDWFRSYLPICWS